VKVVSLVEPKTAINMSLGPEKVVIYVIAGRSHYRDPRPLIYIGEHSGPGKSGRNLRMVVLSDRSLSGSLLYMQLKISKIKIHSREYTMRGTILKKRHQHFETIKDVKIGNYLTINWLPTVAFKSSIGRNKSTRKQLIN